MTALQRAIVWGLTVLLLGGVVLGAAGLVTLFFAPMPGLAMTGGGAFLLTSYGGAVTTYWITYED